MIRAAVVFFLIALAAFALGATGIAGISLEVGKLLLAVFVVAAILSLLGGLITGRGNRKL